MDEVGTDDLLHLDKDRHRFLSLSGVAIAVTEARDKLAPELDKLKAEIFDDDPDSPLILHRKDIMGLKGAFGKLEDGALRRDFDNRIMNLIWDTDFTLFTALIDKKWMLRQKHWTKNHPYHYLMEMIVERYTFFLERKASIGDIMPEARLGKKDELLQLAFDEVKKSGTHYLKPERIFNSIRASKLKFRVKKDNIAGLQLCDLLAHPSHIYARTLMMHEVDLGPFATKIVDCLIERKYDRYANNWIGVGVKFLPQ